MESKEFRGRGSLQAQRVECFVSVFFQVILVKAPHPQEAGQERPLGKENGTGSRVTVCIESLRRRGGQDVTDSCRHLTNWVPVGLVQ